MARTRTAAYDRIEKMLREVGVNIAAARTATSAVDEGIALGKAVARWGAFRVAVSDQRAATAQRAVDAGATIMGYAADVGVSRGMIQQLLHRHNGTLPERYRSRSDAA
jgi:hypothetical protein